jgi:DNA-binding CsgD family transcriptional regulator
MGFGLLGKDLRRRIISESQGNASALMSAARLLVSVDLAGAFSLPDAGIPLVVDTHLRERLVRLPPDTGLLLLLLAAESHGDPALVNRAAARLGIRSDAALPAVADGLIVAGEPLGFRHPALRTVAYRAASALHLQRVHSALAQETDLELDADLYAWHRGRAAPGPDEALAHELECSVTRATQRAGVAAAAEFHELSAVLTTDPVLRARRLLAAAHAKFLVGALDASAVLIREIKVEALTDVALAHLDLLRARLSFARDPTGVELRLLLSAATQLEPLDSGIARDAYLETLAAAMIAGPLDAPDLLRRTAIAAPAVPDSANGADLLFEGLRRVVLEGHASGTPIVRVAVRTLRLDPEPVSEGPLRAVRSYGWLGALAVWDDEAWDILTAGCVSTARDAGVLTLLADALDGRIIFHLVAGELTAAGACIRDREAIYRLTDGRAPLVGSAALTALRGRLIEASERKPAELRSAPSPHGGILIAATQWAFATVNNADGRYVAAMSAAQRACDSCPSLSAFWLAELIEAAVRSGNQETVTDALGRLCLAASASGTDWALGIAARCRALTVNGDEADAEYREAIERLQRTRIGLDLARAHLLYGEWLRRERRRSKARDHLDEARKAFESIGSAAFVRRAAREYGATAVTARKRSLETLDQLTAQEISVARLVCTGLTDREVAERLSISNRTVAYHLQAVFRKLELSSRRDLDRFAATFD